MIYIELIIFALIIVSPYIFSWLIDSRVKAQARQWHCKLTFDKERKTWKCQSKLYSGDDLIGFAKSPEEALFDMQNKISTFNAQLDFTMAKERLDADRSIPISIDTAKE